MRESYTFKCSLKLTHKEIEVSPKHFKVDPFSGFSHTYFLQCSYITRIRNIVLELFKWAQNNFLQSSKETKAFLNFVVREDKNTPKSITEEKKHLQEVVIDLGEPSTPSKRSKNVSLAVLPDIILTFRKSAKSISYRIYSQSQWISDAIFAIFSLVSWVATIRVHGHP